MKSVNVKYILNTKTNKSWEDLDLPAAVVDQNGVLYLIVTGEAMDEDGDEGEFEITTSYYIIDVMNGIADTSGYLSIRDLINSYASTGLELQAVAIDLVINEYLDIQ